MSILGKNEGLLISQHSARLKARNIWRKPVV